MSSVTVITSSSALRTRPWSGRCWMMFWLWYECIAMEETTEMDICRYRWISKTHRQTGQVPLDFSHGRIQGSWKGCLHGRVITICSSGSSVSNLNCSLHTAQSISRVRAMNRIEDTSHRAQEFYLQFSSKTSRGRFAIISSEAGAGLLAFEFSIICVIIWSRAIFEISWELNGWSAQVDPPSWLKT